MSSFLGPKENFLGSNKISVSCLCPRSFFIMKIAQVVRKQKKIYTDLNSMWSAFLLGIFSFMTITKLGISIQGSFETLKGKDRDSSPKLRVLLDLSKNQEDRGQKDIRSHSQASREETETGSWNHMLTAVSEPHAHRCYDESADVTHGSTWKRPSGFQTYF